MTERLGPHVIKGPAGYRTLNGWSPMRGHALSFDDAVSARDWLNSTRPRVGEVLNIPYSAEAELAERTNAGLDTPPARHTRLTSEYDPFNDGPR